MRSGYDHVNRQFQAKTSQHESSNISETINPIKPKFEDQPETLIFTS